jgi:DNA-binding NtrC family response regulator
LSEDELLEHGVERDLVAVVGGLTLQVPPLRDRVEDIPLIVTQLIEETSGYDAKTSAPVPTPEAMAALRAFGWPGNVAQLASVIHGVVERMGPGTVEITLDMLPEALR